MRITSRKQKVRVATKDLVEYLADTMSRREVHYLLTILRRNGLAKRVAIQPNSKGVGRPTAIWELPSNITIDLKAKQSVKQPRKSSDSKRKST